jgi:hypothetical protein
MQLKKFAEGEKKDITFQNKLLISSSSKSQGKGAPKSHIRNLIRQPKTPHQHQTFKA